MPRRQHAPLCTWYTTMDSPFGPVCLVGTEQGLSRVTLQHGDCPLQLDSTWQADTGGLALAQRQLDEYFQGQRRQFNLPVAPGGTPFQQHVWQALQQIPFGTTLTYGEMARRLGMPGAARAVGHANSRNPLAIVIPCHRLIGSDGHLRGYAGGLAFKQRLLQHEGVQVAASARY